MIDAVEWIIHVSGFLFAKMSNKRAKIEREKLFAT